MTITTSTGWEAIGTQRQLGGHRLFTIDAPSIGPEVHEPLLILHGFPTSSFDYAAVLDGLRAGRRVLLLDGLGYGLSAKPDLHYTLALQADLAQAFVAELGLARLALLTHDVGDTVGGELLARRREGSWDVEVTRRVLTNGSIYIEQAHLTNGQLLLLSLPDEKLPPEVPVNAESLAQSLRDTYSPRVSLPPAGSRQDPIPPTVEQILHGFPTSSFDFAAVLDTLRGGRRVLLLDGLGYGLSDKPDRHYTLALQADLAAAFVAELGLTRLALLTHDVGDTVGGELLARRAEGTWDVEVTRRVITNGSIYIEQAHLTNGQQLLLSLPDEKLAPDAPINAASLRRSLIDTYSPAASVPPEGSDDDLLGATVEQIMHDDGHLVLTRLIRYIEERRQNERRFTGAIEADPSPLHIVWGLDDPIAVPSMVDTLVAARPDATVVRLDGVGHYPMVEDPGRFLEAVLPGLE